MTSKKEITYRIPDKFITIEDVIDAMDYLYELPKEKQPKVARQIMVNMEASPDGVMNLGYLVGYYDKKKRRALYSILGISHPLFPEI